MERVILVDEHDRVLGAEEKLRAHQRGVLHRAFSIFVFNAEQALLLQQRAFSKYHSGGLWSNTCCGHPRPGEATQDAAVRRLREELGFSCDLRESFSFLYRAELGGGLIEHEIDHVFIGTYSGEPHPDPNEIAGCRWVTLPELRDSMERQPLEFTYWLRTIRRQHWDALAASLQQAGISSH